MKTMRDSFFDKLYSIALRDKDVIIVVADMGAPSLDKFRENLPNQFLNVGIAEQNMILIATGLSLEGKTVYCYALETFSSLRPLEIIKVDVSCMNIPINIIGTGAGFSYYESGPTHHTTEDISIIRSLPNIRILNPSDSMMAGEMANITYKDKQPTYIRLDRELKPNIYKGDETFNRGFTLFSSGMEPYSHKRVNNKCIITTGNLVSQAITIGKVDVIDLYLLNPIPKEIIMEIREYDYIITWEEHQLNGGLGSIISELITDNRINTKLIRVGIDGLYTYQYGDRNTIRQDLNIDISFVKNKIMELENESLI